MEIILKPPLDLLKRGELSFVEQNQLFSAGQSQSWCLSLDIRGFPKLGGGPTMEYEWSRPEPSREGTAS